MLIEVQNSSDMIQRYIDMVEISNLVLNTSEVETLLVVPC